MVPMSAPANHIVIVQGCGQTLGLGLGQSKDITVVLLLVYNGQRVRK